MKFVDEAVIQVEAGAGGSGCLSFRREKFIQFGGPDGGSGGSGGSVYIQANADNNTLVDYRYTRIFKAKRGEGGKGRNCTGISSDDIVLRVPVGTTLIDEDTEEVLGDLVRSDQKILVAKGGRGGMGNTVFKSSTNRSPRKTTPGTPGEMRRIRLELKVLADVGLLGMPNAGKSTFIRAVSAAKPKVANYPFTTLIPNLGVVDVNRHRSFVVADIPGLIEGAAEGAGLGIRFLKHLARTRLLLHIVDVAPYDGSDPVAAVEAIAAELEKFSATLSRRDRWLVLNKLDLLPEGDAEKVCNDIITRLNWQGPIFKIAAISKQGTQAVCYEIMDHLEEKALQEKEDQDKAEAETLMRLELEKEAREKIRELNNERELVKRERKAGAKNSVDSDDDDEDEGDVEVFYEP